MKNASEMSYEKLTIRNKFMFGKVTKNPVIAQKLADLLTPVKIGRLQKLTENTFYNIAVPPNL